MEQAHEEVEFPLGLLDWAGHRAGGVRKIFYSSSGRPSGKVIKTGLINRLDEWSRSLASRSEGVPTTLLLVGGPGNGKTESVEFTIHSLDKHFGLGGRLLDELSSQFINLGDRPPPRIARVDLSALSNHRLDFEIAIVQDASVSDSNQPGLSPADLLVNDLESLNGATKKCVYIACVNRGILDDSLVASIESRRIHAKTVLEAVVKSVGLTPGAPSCWPLSEFPDIAAWPMDVETLVGRSDDDEESPLEQLLGEAILPSRWPRFGECPAGERCPYCTSRELLSREPYRTSIVKILRWYEIASGKRWSFRDLFSLTSFLLAGVTESNSSISDASPCARAKRLSDISSNPTSKPESLRLSAPFLLVAAQYQQALFGCWPRSGLREFRANINELKLDPLVHGTLMGLYHFLNSNGKMSIPPTLESQLSGICELLDPALASPDFMIELSSKTTVPIREIDARFSQSVGEGFRYLQKYQCLTDIEKDLLKRLDYADQKLSDQDVVSRRPAVAARVQSIIRDFSCRMVRRTLGVRSAVVKDVRMLDGYQKVIDGDPQLLYDASRQLEGLLNDKDKFEVVLNKTFGEPLPPAQSRAVLTTQKQRVTSLHLPEDGRPKVALRFLSVGSLGHKHPIPLTYELFKSVRELRAGMMPASLPRSVVALLDTTKAKLAGQIVRDEDQLDGSQIHIGNRVDVIGRELQKFVVHQEGDE